MKFLTDAMLGRLTTYLRMCGYDTAYVLDRRSDPTDTFVRTVCQRESRKLLTRDTELAAECPGILIESTDIDEQLRQLVRAGIDLSLAEPTRCSKCNGILAQLKPSASTPEFAPDPAERSVWQCTDCDQPYWKGSHWHDVQARLRRINASETGPTGSEP